MLTDCMRSKVKINTTIVTMFMSTFAVKLLETKFWVTEFLVKMTIKNVYNNYYCEVVVIHLY